MKTEYFALERNNELHYRGYFILDGTAHHDFLGDPPVFVFKDIDDEKVLARMNSVEQAKTYIDRLHHENGFNKQFEEIINVENE